jgi:hypothetical protein
VARSNKQPQDGYIHFPDLLSKHVYLLKLECRRRVDESTQQDGVDKQNYKSSNTKHALAEHRILRNTAVLLRSWKVRRSSLATRDHGGLLKHLSIPNRSTNYPFRANDTFGITEYNHIRETESLVCQGKKRSPVFVLR